MGKKINYLELSYPRFVLGQIIDPEEVNQNNFDIQNKVNEFVDEVEAAMSIAENADVKSSTANTKADGAVVIANQADAKADSAVNTATQANAKADNAVSVANQANTEATNALNTANAVQADYNTQKPIIQQAVIDANNASASVAEKADKSYIDEVANNFTMGVLYDGSIGDEKLDNSPSAIKARVATHLADLASHGAGALNEYIAYDGNGNIQTYEIRDGVTVKYSCTIQRDIEGNITGEVEVYDGKTVTSTINRVDGKIVSITKAVS